MNLQPSPPPPPLLSPIQKADQVRPQRPLPHVCGHPLRHMSFLPTCFYQSEKGAGGMGVRGVWWWAPTSRERHTTASRALGEAWSVMAGSPMGQGSQLKG